MYIRKQQKTDLTSYMWQHFEDRMVEHVNQFFPRKTAKMEEAQVRAAIREGSVKATDYYIERECDVAKFIDLKFAIHMEFDTHEELPWVGEILNDNSKSGQEKIDRIYAELPDRLRALHAQSKSKS